MFTPPPFCSQLDRKIHEQDKVQNGLHVCLSLIGGIDRRDTPHSRTHTHSHSADIGGSDFEKMFLTGRAKLRSRLERSCREMYAIVHRPAGEHVVPAMTPNVELRSTSGDRQANTEGEGTNRRCASEHHAQKS